MSKLCRTKTRIDLLPYLLTSRTISLINISTIFTYSYYTNLIVASNGHFFAFELFCLSYLAYVYQIVDFKADSSTNQVRVISIRADVYIFFIDKRLLDLPVIVLHYFNWCFQRLFLRFRILRDLSWILLNKC